MEKEQSEGYQPKTYFEMLNRMFPGIVEEMEMAFHDLENSDEAEFIGALIEYSVEHIIQTKYVAKKTTTKPKNKTSSSGKP